MNNDMNLVQEEIKVGISDLRDLIEAIKSKYEFDFSHYAMASFQRRIHRALTIYELPGVDILINRLSEDENFFNQFLKEITVNTTEMFRDPSFWRSMRDEILPQLRHLERIRIWHAGCSSGEEVYSLSILMKEAGLDHKAQVYASDINADVLTSAREGKYSTRNLKLNAENYQRFGGLYKLDSYIRDTSGHYYFMDPALIENVRFITHDLVSGDVITKFDLILCRNVMIYFDKTLQDKVARLFYDSLFKKGFLVIGAKESLRWSVVAKKFDVVNDNEKIYQVR